MFGAATVMMMKNFGGGGCATTAMHDDEKLEDDNVNEACNMSGTNGRDGPLDVLATEQKLPKHGRAAEGVKQ